MEAPVDLNRFVLTMTETAYAQVKAACDGLTDEQFFSQPTTDSNPIAWLVWHMSRARDVITSNISGENQVWVSNGWADRFGMDAEDVGIGDSPEKVAAFRAERSLVMGYLDDAHEATMVADACWREFTDGVPWHRIAVLFRTNAQSALFETAFSRRGVPFRVTGAARFARMPFPLPPLRLQSEFAKRRAVQRRLAERLRQRSSETDDLFNSLVQRAFKGEL